MAFRLQIPDVEETLIFANENKFTRVTGINKEVFSPADTIGLFLENDNYRFIADVTFSRQGKLDMHLSAARISSKNFDYGIEIAEPGKVVFRVPMKLDLAPYHDFARRVKGVSIHEASGRDTKYSSIEISAMESPDNALHELGRVVGTDGIIPGSLRTSYEFLGQVLNNLTRR